VFKKGDIISLDKRAGLKKLIRIEASPCITNCYVHNFTTPPIGPQEISPNNGFPLFPVYGGFLHEFHKSYLFSVHFLNIVTNYEDYQKPIIKNIGVP
jgi:hypothetical protein